MKETRYFYVPDALHECELPADEAKHALRVLRLGVGDEINLMDGDGLFLRAEISAQTGHRCLYRVIESEPQQRVWTGHLHIAMAPTKMSERDCQYSERHQLKTERIERIVVSAVKQSHKAWMPRVNPMQTLDSFMRANQTGERFICHCYDPHDISQESVILPLFDLLKSGSDVTVLVGPEGDFSIEEVRQAERLGWRSVTLGKSRLRTETAALVAVHLMQLSHQLPV